ncbi:MAG TPA: hypothetical protein VGF24_12050 [Vicinamibacterales bacterium]|jgi:hypothetical protein
MTVEVRFFKRDRRADDSIVRGCQPSSSKMRACLLPLKQSGVR